MTAPAVTGEAQEQRTGIEAETTGLKDRLQQFLAFASLIAIFAFFSVASSNFLNYANVTAILFSTVVIGLLALGTTFVIITGGIDLSIGTGMTLCAVMSGVLIVNTGVMISARLASAQPGTGLGYELQAIAAVVIGGTSLSGGKGSIVGTIIGALIISVLNNGLQIMSIPQEWQNVILGIVILVAVYADMARKRTA